jgi:hypothetical protein
MSGSTRCPTTAAHPQWRVGEQECLAYLYLLQGDDIESIGAAVAVGRFINDLQLPPSLLLFLDQVHAQELNRRLR